MKEKTKLKHPNRRCNSESAKEVTIRTNDNKNALVDERGRIICAVPLVDCKHPGKPVVEGPDTAVKMKCSHNQCQLQSKPIHMDCFRTLEEKMMTILQHLPHRTSRWTTQQMRNNLWDKKGMSLIEKHMRCKCGNGVVVRDEDAWDKSQKQLHAGEEKKRRTTKKRTLPALGTRSVSECIDTNENFPASSLNFESNQPTVLKYPIGYAPIANETGNRQGKPNVSSVTEFPPLSGDSWQVAGPSRRRGVSFSTVAKASVKPLTTIVPSVAQNATAPKSSFTQNLRSKRTATLVSHSYPKTTVAGLPELLNANIIRASAMNDVSSNNNEWEWDVESDFYECERPVELGNRYRYDEADDWGFSHNFGREETWDFPRSFGQDSGYRHSGSIPDFDDDYRPDRRSVDGHDRHKYSNDNSRDYGNHCWNRHSDDLCLRDDDRYRRSDDPFAFSHTQGEYDRFHGRSTYGVIGRGWSGSDDDSDIRFNFCSLRNELDNQKPSDDGYSPGW